MCSECEKSLPNQIVFDKIELILKKMQDEQTGLPVKTAKSFMTKIPSVFTGTDLIQWMMKNLKLEDQQEAIHLANLIASHGYIFPIEDHTLSIKNDCTFYRFQTPCLWPSNNIDPENTDYAVYLCKRTMQGKTRLELADYEAENLARLQKMFSRKWEFIFMQAESQAKVDKKRDKLERKVLDSQERAFWDVYRPVPGCVNTTELDIKKACRLSKSSKRCGECQKISTPTAISGSTLAPSGVRRDVPTDEPVRARGKLVGRTDGPVGEIEIPKKQREQSETLTEEEKKSDQSMESSEKKTSTCQKETSEETSGCLALGSETSGQTSGNELKNQQEEAPRVSEGGDENKQAHPHSHSHPHQHHHHHHHHHHHRHHHHPHHSHANTGHHHHHHHHHHHRQCPHHQAQKQSDGQQTPTNAGGLNSRSGSSRTKKHAPSARLSPSASNNQHQHHQHQQQQQQQQQQEARLESRPATGTEGAKMNSAEPAVQSQNSADSQNSRKEPPEAAVEAEKTAEGAPETRPASACCVSNKTQNVAPQSGQQQQQHKRPASCQVRKSSLNILRPPSADQAFASNSPSCGEQTQQLRKGSINMRSSTSCAARAQLKSTQSVFGTGGVEAAASGSSRDTSSSCSRQNLLNSNDKEVLGSTNASLMERQSINDLERELQTLKIRMDRGGVKMSKVNQSYLSYFNQWAEYDPFIVQPIPSNPWQNDSTELWDTERQTKDVHCRRVRRWAFSLKELLNDPAGREQFHRFLEKEFSAENLKFWDAVQELKRVHAKDVGRKVEAIWTEYLAQDANCPINIDSKSYETSKKNMAKNRSNRCIFDEAAGHVYQLMKNDSYPRYLRSDMYKDYKEASERRRPNQVAFDVFKPQITTLKHKFNF